MRATQKRWVARGFGAALLAFLLSAGGGCDGNRDSSSSGSAAPPASAALEAIRARGVLRIAVYTDKPPFGYVDSEGGNQGYDIELARRLAKDFFGDENKVNFVPTDPQSRIDLLNSGNVDIMLANFTRTPERAEQVDFALPYMKTGIGVVSPKSAPIAAIEDLRGKKLAVVKGTTAESWLTRNHPDIQRVSFDHNTAAFNALEKGHAAGLAHDNTLLYAWITKNATFAVALDWFGGDDVIAPAVKKGDADLLNWLNGEIRQLYAEKFFFEDYDKSLRPFYGQDIDPANIVISNE
ncbi:MAG: transporter substrate-binding domain-containing protein [Azoarcus sp.]|jgi:polar amino acid transport system substrate-binding protein|nr:transporter substrate-binding domain-containing protein [Azoarcus sp.]